LGKLVRCAEDDADIVDDELPKLDDDSSGLRSIVRLLSLIIREFELRGDRVDI